MKAAYPRIDDCLEFLMNEFGLTELKWNNPIKPDSRTFKEYTIYCFPEYNPNNRGKSFGGAICAVNDTIWSAFSSTEFRNTLEILFSGVPDLKEEFRELIKSKLPRDLPYRFSIYYEGITASYDPSKVRESNKTIMDLLDEVSPYLFVNLLRIDYIWSNGLGFVME